MSATALPRPVTEPTDTSGLARRLLWRASLTAVVADLALMAIIGEVIPPLAVFAVLTVAALGLFRVRPRAGAIALLVAAAVANIGGAPFLAGDLMHPADVTAFLWATLSGGGRLIVIVAGVLFLRERDGTARRVGRAALVLLGAALAITAVARATVTSDVRQAGDVDVVVKDATYPGPITATAGATLFVDNQDQYRHTFTIEGTDVNVALPPTADRRVMLDLPPGEYRLYCTVPGHESMTTTLEVTG